MARIGFVHLAVVCCGMLTLNLGAQTPAQPPVPPVPGSETENHDNSDPGKNHGDHKNPDGLGKKDPGMGRRGEGGPMGGPNMGGPQFEKMVELALGPEKDIEDAIQNWPRMKDKENEPEAHDRLLKQIENFRRFLKSQAMREAEQMGLKIPPEQEDAFVAAFWKKKLEVDRTLRKEMEPRKRELSDKMAEELKKQFGS